MNALPGLICSFLISGMLAMAGVVLPVGGPVTTGLHYDSFGHLRSRVAYDGTRSLASDYDSGPAVPTREKENGLERTNAIFAKFREFLAAEGTTLFSRELGSAGPRATTELLDAMRAQGRTVTIAGEGSEGLRFLNAMDAEASVGGPGHLNILLRENPSRAAAMEEFLHGTQDRLGIIDRLGVQGAESHVTDFMTRHSRLLGLEP